MSPDFTLLPLDAPEEEALRPRRPRRRLVRRVLGACLVVLAGGVPVTACDTPAPTGALGRIKKAGKIIIATDALYPPNEFKQGEQIVGFDVDLGNAVAKRLGVTAEFQDVKFDTILQALHEGKYDISLSSFTDTKERETRFDFVTYLSAGTMLLVRKGDAQRLHPTDLSLCGRRIAVEKGSTQDDELIHRSAARPEAGRRIETCRTARRPAPVRMPFDTQAGAVQALLKGRADAVLADAPSVIYDARQSGGRLEVSGAAYGTALYGVAMRKRQVDLRNAIFNAIKELIATGEYRRLTEKWGISSGVVSEPQVNAAG